MIQLAWKCNAPHQQLKQCQLALIEKNISAWWSTENIHQLHNSHLLHVKVEWVYTPTQIRSRTVRKLTSWSASCWKICSMCLKSDFQWPIKLDSRFAASIFFSGPSFWSSSALPLLSTKRLASLWLFFMARYIENSSRVKKSSKEKKNKNLKFHWVTVVFLSWLTTYPPLRILVM